MSNAMQISEPELFRLIDGVCECFERSENTAHFVIESKVGQSLALRFGDNPVHVACDVLEFVYPIPSVESTTAVLRSMFDREDAQHDAGLFVLDTTFSIFNAIASLAEIPQALKDRARCAMRAMFDNPSGEFVFDDNFGRGERKKFSM